MTHACPVCESQELIPVITRERLPVMQNVVYATRAAALAAPCAPFTLSTCAACQFSFNSAFDPELLRYDENYDNDVPSRIFRDYYRDLSRMLVADLDLTGGTVYDVGCGKGTFLEILCAEAPAIQGIGIDPSCQPRDSGNPRLIQAMFSPQHFAEGARLVLSRHVLEHIPRPLAFLQALRSAVPDGTPLFVEVPELDWILRHDAFWDFCYEHCNYFTPDTLAGAMARAGFAAERQQTSFGDQYQWALGRAGQPVSRPSPAGDGLARSRDYARRERANVERARSLVTEAAGQGPCVLWGMATKGVVFASLTGGERLAGGVDINPNKQGKFVPGTGLQIHPPEWLCGLGDSVTVLVMNPNYMPEIRARLSDLRVKAQLVSL